MYITCKTNCILYSYLKHILFKISQTCNINYTQYIVNGIGMKANAYRILFPNYYTNSLTCNIHFLNSTNFIFNQFKSNKFSRFFFCWVYLFALYLPSTLKVCQVNICNIEQLLYYQNTVELQWLEDLWDLEN